MGPTVEVFILMLVTINVARQKGTKLSLNDRVQSTQPPKSRTNSRLFSGLLVNVNVKIPH